MKLKLSEAYLEGLQPRAAPVEVLDTQIDGLLVRVQPSGLKTYYVKYRLPDGRRTRTKLGRVGSMALKDARDVAKRTIGEVAKGSIPNDEARIRRTTSERERNAHTVGSFIREVYGPWVKANRVSGAATFKRLETAFSGFDRTRLADLNAWIVEKWRSHRLKAGTKPATVNRDLTALKAMLAKAVEWGELEAHPLATVKPSKVDQQGKIRYLSGDESERLRAALPGAPRYLQTLVLLALNTGLRRGELFALKWSNVNLHTRTLTVEGATAKSGMTRHVPLNDEAVAALRRWKAEAVQADGLVFPGRDGERLVTVKKSWATLRDAAMLEAFRFHDCRHDFASKLVMAGVDLNTVRDLLGHADIKMTLRYAHLAPEHRAEAVQRLCRDV